MKRRSEMILSGSEWANVRSLYKSSGYTDTELKKPMIAVVNTYNNICPGHIVLKDLAQRVKEGIYAAGGTALEFSTIGACDGIAMGHVGMKYILPTREMIANDVEAMVQSCQLDGMVLLGSCDKIVPGLLMSAVRLNIPAIFLNGGPTLPGRMTENNPYGGTTIDHSIIQQSEGALKSGTISEEEFAWIENNAVPTVGSCAMLGTANTMCCLAEAMGISLPGSSTVPAVYSHRNQLAYYTGEQIMHLVNKNICPRDIITKESIQNAVKVNSAIGGSTNAVLHLLALAYEAEIDFTIEDFGNISAKIPHLVPLIPAGSYTLLDFYEAGGIPAIMSTMSQHLQLDGMTCTGNTMQKNLDGVKVHNRDVIRTLDNAVHSCGGIAILSGNLAPDGAVTKPSAIPEGAHYFEGTAVIFENEQSALDGIRGHQIKAGDVVVIRNEGPKGGPGMPEMYKAMKLLVGMGLGAQVCVITDGRFSGSNNGCFVGHICPEAAEDGPIAYLRNGDRVVVDVDGGKINAPDVDFEARRKEGHSIVQDAASGYLYQYRKNVMSASKGAVIQTR